MRLIFISLLVANIAVAIWGLFLKEPSETASPSPDSPSVVLKTSPEQADISKPDHEQVPGVSEGARNTLCELIGPFEGDSDASAFVDRLASIDVASLVQSIELPAGSSFWVHLAPEETREAAFRRLAELQAQGLESYVIGKGPLANAVSLGVFTVESLADARMENLQGAGLVPVKTEFERKELELWVEIQPEEAEKMSELTWTRMMEGLSSQERRQNFCLPVAS